MNVSLKNNDAASGILTLKVEKKDYEVQVEKGLRQYRQQANIPGFRKGMVPMGMIKRMYGKYILAEEVNKVVSANILKYIRENEINVLGEPVPNETEQQPFDFDTQDEFEFVFDIAIAPEINIKLTKHDKLTSYEIEVDDEIVRKQIENYRKNFASYDTVETDIRESDVVRGIVSEQENGAPKAGGILIEDAVLMPMHMKGEQERAKFIGANLNDIIVFNPYEAYQGAAAEMALFLRVEKEMAATITNDFHFEIKEITRYKEAELNQELFDKVFGEGIVKTEDEFVEQVKASLQDQFKWQSEYKFMLDVRELLIKKAEDIQFADDILKRWLLTADEKTTIEKVEEDYPKVIEDIKFHLAKEKIVKENELKVEDAEVEQTAKQVAKAQFAQYGMFSVPDDILTDYAADMLKKKETLQNMVNRAIEEKLVIWVKEQVEIEPESITFDAFRQMLA
ncbi:MAG: trigger factor [Tannerella sp.]|jgi:trigger factor|nr:trigger factor [Tannerella sp.]